MKKIIIAILKSKVGRIFVETIIDSFMKKLMAEAQRQGKSIDLMIVYNACKPIELIDKVIDEL